MTSTSVATKGAEDAAKPRRQGSQAIVIAREIEVLSRQTRTRELCRQTVRSAQINASPVSLSNDNGLSVAILLLTEHRDRGPV